MAKKPTITAKSIQSKRLRKYAPSSQRTFVKSAIINTRSAGRKVTQSTVQREIQRMMRGIRTGSRKKS